MPGNVARRWERERGPEAARTVLVRKRINPGAEDRDPQEYAPPPHPLTARRAAILPR